MFRLKQARYWWHARRRDVRTLRDSLVPYRETHEKRLQWVVLRGEPFRVARALDPHLDSGIRYALHK